MSKLDDKAATDKTPSQIPPRCHAQKDGECNWKDCPPHQTFNDNGHVYQHCPYDHYWSKIDDENEI